MCHCTISTASCIRENTNAWTKVVRMLRDDGDLILLGKILIL